jgi:hypothetical protein
VSGVRLAAYGLATVDTAAIAAAVAAELTIPTTAEIATAVGAQAACAAAITAAGIPAATATAVGAQAACAAAIDAKTGDIAAAVAAAVPDTADLQAAYGAAWGTVLQVKAQYFGATAIDQTGKLIAAPGAGLRIEILYWGVTSFATAGPFSWSSGATLNLDTGPDVQTRNLAKGSQISEAAISPTKPLYTLAENADFGITLDVDSEVIVDIKYRVVSTS